MQPGIRLWSKVKFIMRKKKKKEEVNKWVEKLKELSDEEILEKEKHLILKYSIFSTLGFLVAIIAFILFLLVL